MRLLTRYFKRWKMSSDFPFMRRLCNIGFVHVNGVKLHYLDWGGKGETILFLTGALCTAHDFDNLASKFTDRFHVLGVNPSWTGRIRQT